MAETMNNLFDDSDDSDEEMAQPTTQPEQQQEAAAADPSSSPAPPKNDNARLFGSDSDDSDDNAEETTENQKAAPSNTNANTNTNTNTNTNANDNDNDNDEDSDADLEFNADDDITGKSAPVRREVKSERSDSPVVPPSKVTVPDFPLTQFQDKKVSLHMAQLPKIVGVQVEGFSRDTFNSSLEEEEFKGRVHSMIRWRYKTDANGNFVKDENGKQVKESNAKIIKWSDGSYGLRVGDEVFDMDAISYQLNKPAGGKNQKAPAATPVSAAKRKGPFSKDFLYLTQKAQDGERKPIGTVLQCVASLESKFIPRPASLKSAAHKNFVLKERSRVIKRATIQEFVTFVDPEKQKQERIQNKDDIMKQEKRSGGKRSGGDKRRSGMHRAYMEDEDDEHYDSVNIRSLKKRNMNDEDMDYGDDYGDDDEDDVWSKRKKKVFESGRKIGQQQQYESDEEEEVVVDDEDDDDEEEMVSRKKKAKSAPTQGKAAFSDSDSD
jgi:RNA polymerase-associated protein LEO1